MKSIKTSKHIDSSSRSKASLLSGGSQTHRELNNLQMKTQQQSATTLGQLLDKSNSKRYLYDKKLVYPYKQDKNKTVGQNQPGSSSFVMPRFSPPRQRNQLLSTLTPKRTTGAFSQQTPFGGNQSHQYSYHHNGTILNNRSSYKENTNNGTLGGSSYNAIVNKRYQADEHSNSSYSHMGTSFKNTFLLDNNGNNAQQQCVLDQIQNYQFNMPGQQSPSIKDIMMSSNDEGSGQDSMKSSQQNDKGIVDKHIQIFSFSKTPKFGKNGQMVNKNNLFEINNGMGNGADGRNTLESYRLMTSGCDAGFYSSRSSHELNDQIFEEFNTNNDESKENSKKQSLQSLTNSKTSHNNNQIAPTNINLKDYSTMDRCEQYGHQIQMLIQSNDDNMNKQYLRESLQYSDSQQMSIETQQIYPLSTPSQAIFSDFKRSKTPTMQTSGYILQSFDAEMSIKEKDAAVIRPTATIKNPFIKFNDEDAKIYTPFKSFVKTGQDMQLLTGKPTLQRCETEVQGLKKYDSNINEQMKHFFSNGNNNNNNHDQNVYQTLCSDTQYAQMYNEEVEKHECTKRALNKAIQLANLLLDELQQDNTKSIKSFTQKQQDSSLFYNSQQSLTQHSRYHTPEPLCIINQQYRHEKIGAVTHFTENIEPGAGTISPSMITPTNRQNLSRKRSLKSSNRELSELTNLIRKTKNSPHIVNAKQSRNRNATSQLLYNTTGEYYKHPDLDKQYLSFEQSGEIKNFNNSNSNLNNISTNLNELFHKVNFLKNFHDQKQGGNHDQVNIEDSIQSNKHESEKIKNIRILTKQLFRELKMNKQSV